jgi:NAD(P)H-hydrate repair Nnr-like enzyme with NAD(P)H-hydrate dehydratase domain
MNVSRAVFHVPEPPVDAVDFVLTPHERDIAAIAKVQIERLRRERNRIDESRGLMAELHRLSGDES